MTGGAFLLLGTIVRETSSVEKKRNLGECLDLAFGSTKGTKPPMHAYIFFEITALYMEFYFALLNSICVWSEKASL